VHSLTVVLLTQIHYFVVLRCGVTTGGNPRIPMVLPARQFC
jgi:hypothetical protein